MHASWALYPPSHSSSTHFQTSFLGGEIGTQAFTASCLIVACVRNMRSKTLALRSTFEIGSPDTAQAGFKPSIFLALS